MSPMTTLADVAGWLAGASLSGDGATQLMRVHTDTRTVEAGDLFFALQGERYDANQFLAEAMQRGAAAVVCRGGLAADQYRQACRASKWPIRCKPCSNWRPPGAHSSRCR